MDIKDYIFAGRVSKKEDMHESARLYYQKLYKEIQEDNVEFPILEVCYTTERTCEFVEFDNQKYIIYDRYIGQTLNMFNRIFYNSANEIDSIIYGYKYYAEIFHYAGNDKMSKASALSYLINREKMGSYRKAADLKKRAWTTMIQEKFILLHEMYHYKFSLLSSEMKQEKIAKRKIELLGYLIAHDEMNIDRKSIFKEILCDMCKFNLDEAQTLLENDVEIKQVFKEFNQMSNKVQNVDMLETIIKRDDLIEEILCDEYALARLLEVETDFSFYDVICMIFIGIESLELMTLMRYDVIYYKQKKDKILITDMIVRKIAFRKISALKLSILKEIDIEEIQKKLVSVNVQFSKIIRDPIMSFTLKSISNVAKIPNIEKQIENLDELIPEL